MKQKNSGIWKILGILCIGLGIIGLFLPVIQGILLIVAGLALLGHVKLGRNKK